MVVQESDRQIWLVIRVAVRTARQFLLEQGWE